MSDCYENARHQVRQLLTVGSALGGAVLTTGTNTAYVEVYRFKFPRKVHVDEAMVYFKTGASGSVSDGAAGVLIQKATSSATTAIGTYAYTASMLLASGTDGTFTMATGTNVDFAKGESLMVSTNIGTVDAAGVLAWVTIGWKEDFPSTADVDTGG